MGSLEALDPTSLIPDERRRSLLDQYAELLIHFNRRINLISKNSAESVWKQHIEHCLNLARRSFPNGSRVVDWGTGGGLPAIPLAICFPAVEFIAIDSVGKKIQAVRAMARKLGLENLEAWQGRAETWTGTIHYSVSRATAPLVDLWFWHERVAVASEHDDVSGWLPGLICLKGGDLGDEIRQLRQRYPQTEVVQELIEERQAVDVSAEKYIMQVK